MGDRRSTVFHRSWRRVIGFRLLNDDHLDGNFHSLKAVPTTTQEVVRYGLRQLKHISTSPCYVLNEVRLHAVFITRLVHLQHVVPGLVESKIFLTPPTTTYFGFHKVQRTQ